MCACKITENQRDGKINKGKNNPPQPSRRDGWGGSLFYKTSSAKTSIPDRFSLP